MTDWASSDRHDTFRAYLIDPFTLTTVREVPFDAAGSSFDAALGGANVTGAKVKLEEGEDYRDGGRSLMVRLTDHVEADGTEYDRTFGTFFVESPDSNSRFGRVSRTLSCYSALWRFSKSHLDSDLTYPAHTRIADIVRYVVEQDGGMVRFAPDAPVLAECQGNVWFELGALKADVLATLCSWMWCDLVPDDDGVLLVRPIVNPSTAAPSYVFEAGKNCVYKPGISWGTNRGELINRVIFVLSANGQGARAVSRLPAASPSSFENTGVWRDEVVVVSEVPAGGLQNAADSYLAQRSAEALTIEVEHVDVPTLRVGDVVRYINSKDHTAPVNVVGQLVQTGIGSLRPGCMTHSKIQIARWN